MTRSEWRAISSASTVNASNAMIASAERTETETWVTGVDGSLAAASPDAPAIARTITT